jgi:hypothetical protein
MAELGRADAAALPLSHATTLISCNKETETIEE